MPPPTEQPSPPAELLACYGSALAGLTWRAQTGGLSGACVWRGDDPSGRPCVAVKRWPPDMTVARLRVIHARMDQAARLPFVPTLVRAADGGSVVTVAGGVWDATEWRPGRPAEPLTCPAVRAAAEALARLHAAWPPAGSGPSPAVLSRLRVLTDFPTMFPVPPQPSPAEPPELGPLLRQAWQAVTRCRGVWIDLLRPWADRTFRLRPCLRDCRSEHVLFVGDEVSGIVDYGAVGEDTPAADLARYVGDAEPGTGDTLVSLACRAYRSAGGQTDFDPPFVQLLMRAGLVGSLVGWLARQAAGRLPAGPPAVARLTALLRRVEDFAPD